ncbi:MAG: hypothetical protein LC744_07050 [Chloroflexi bacterium]|nr:hypothetical protein [Chloroflexota bacterium]
MTGGEQPATSGAGEPADPGRPRVRAGALRLRGSARRAIRLAHLVAALGWIGADVVVGVLAVTGFTSGDPGTVAASYIALHAFAVPVLLTFGLTALGSGLGLSVTSGWGIIRYWWVAAKLLINVVLSGLVLILLQPRLATASAAAVRVDVTLADRLERIPLDLLFPAFVSGAALLAASLLGTFKPWGRTPFGRRRSSTTGRSPT